MTDAGDGKQTVALRDFIVVDSLIEAYVSDEVQTENSL